MHEGRNPNMKILFPAVGSSRRPHPFVTAAAITAVAAALIVLSAIPPAATAQESRASAKISRFGEYQGYSAPVYDSWVRTSRYLTMRDGVRLAADIIRPALAGRVEEKPLPAIFTHTRYRRAAVNREGKIESEADSPLSQAFLKHGYIIVVVDVRGSGASFGTWQGLFNPDETADAHEIIEWLAAQPWCDGNIGMTGASYLGATQLMAASTRPPHLKALFPIVPPFDLYDVGYHNGVYFKDLIKTWNDLTILLDTKLPAAPVDEDPDGAMLRAALKEHERNRPTIDLFPPRLFRDSVDPVTQACVLRDWHPAGRVREITESQIPMYLWAGWYDAFTRDDLLMYENFNVPRKLAVGVWPHSPQDPDIQKEELRLAVVEELRWFDHWLKGIDNGVMGEPPIRYSVMRSPKSWEWRAASVWPLAEARATDFYFGAGPSGSARSANDGLLAASVRGEVEEARVTGREGRDLYTPDDTATTGTTTRWDNAVGGGFGYPDMAANDAKGLTYTTAPLDRDVEVTGHPVVRLWVSSTAADGDFFAYLEEVDETGFSHYITEGAIKASMRALGEAPYDVMGLPYHRCFAEDARPLTPGEPVELVFDMQPTSNIFDAGHRIRLTITCADSDNAETEALHPAPVVTVYREAGKASRLVLPVVGAQAGGGEKAAGRKAAEQKTEAGSLLTYALFVVFAVIVLVVVFSYYLRRRMK
jgi:putative CocE/NonD family hydrolase